LPKKGFKNNDQKWIDLDDFDEDFATADREEEEDFKKANISAFLIDP